nr:MAG TPA: hypothetical protein [Caudoviricetes sp.]
MRQESAAIIAAIRLAAHGRRVSTPDTCRRVDDGS